MNTARNTPGSGGTQTAALAFSGDLGPPGSTTATEAWNGTAWSNYPNMSAARQDLAGAGTQSLLL
jgi:hypothetical protein